MLLLENALGAVAEKQVKVARKQQHRICSRRTKMDKQAEDARCEWAGWGLTSASSGGER